MRVDLSRFISAHELDFSRALFEIEHGQKQSHWIWYIFPQLKGLGKSSISDYYGLTSVEEVRAFYEHPVLGKNLIRITTALLRLNCSDAAVVMGSHVDSVKLKSSMTLFDAVINDTAIFGDVLKKYFDGKKDPRTLNMLDMMRSD